MLSLNANLFSKYEGDNYIYHFAFYLFIAALIVLGVVYPIISVIALVLLAFYVLLALPCNVFYALFFLMPFASIFKTSPSSTSFFTYIMLGAVLKLLLSTKRFRVNFIIFYLVFLCYIMIGMQGNYTVFIKQAVILPFIHFFFKTEKIDFRRFGLNYANGVLISGIVALLDNHIPNLHDYIVNDVAYELGYDVTRFSGLYSDPNYYSTALILAISFIFILYSHKMLGGITFVYYAVTAYLGAQTISRSFLLLFAILSLLFVVDLFVNKKYKTAFALVVMLLIALSFVLSGRITLFDNIIDRFIYAQDGDITGNRMNILDKYLDYFSQNPIKTIVGSGIGASYLGGAAHNTYVDFVYYYGVIGTVLFVVTLVISLNVMCRFKKNISNYLPLVCTAISIFFLSGLLYYDFAFNLIICTYVFTYNFKKANSLSVTNNLD